MITFACKKISHEELIRCSFNLNKTDYNVLMFLLRNESMFTTIQIAKNMSLERTTVQKAVKNLLTNNLIKRLQRNLPKGGYIFFYKANEKNEIKNKIKQIIYKWYELMEKEIDIL